MSYEHLKISAIKPSIPGLLFDFKDEINFLKLLHLKWSIE